MQENQANKAVKPQKIKKSYAFKPRIAEYFSNKLCMQMANDTDYRTLLNCEKGLIPFKTKGRGITGIGDMKLEFQTAFITKPNKITQTIREGVAVLQKNYTTHAKRVPVLPDVVSVDHLAQDIKDLTKVPVGVNYDTKYNETYDFFKDKITVFCGNAMSENEDFFFSLFNIFKKIPQTKVRVLDPVKSYDVSKIPVECFTDNFDAVIPALMQEMQTASEIKRVYLINGASRLKDKINDQTKALFEQFMRSFKDNESTILLLVDNASGLQKLQLETWYDEVIEKKRGIWLGDGVAEQVVISTPRIEPEIKQLSFDDMAFIITEEAVIPFKKVVTDKEDADEK